ncbi:MAG TPA: nuclear transport factor 2 family protein [Candidatus Binatia bacterium]|nr:nuclear transport factor 2 family protein [Candidatus Binatia bacterium]
MSAETAPPSAPAAEHENARRVRELFGAFRTGDVAVIERTIAEDCVWRFPGRRGQLAGAHAGRDAILRFLLRVPELTGGTFQLDLIDVLANDRHAIALFRGRGSRNGKELDNPTCLRIQLEAGQAVEVWEFVWDLEHVEEFWS